MNEPFYERERELTVCPGTGRIRKITTTTFECAGRGYVEDAWDYHNGDVDRDECPFCPGTGRIRKITTTTFEPF
jgi:DnaJ-class molecular chaperone